MTDTIERRVLYIDSRDRDYGVHPTPTSYRVTLPKSYYNVVDARLLSIELPNSFYVFSTTHANTTVRVRLGGVQQDVVIPDGNYTDATMAGTLALALGDAFPGETFQAAIDPTTLRLILECTSTPSATLDIDTTVHCDPAKPTDWGLGYYLGFDPLTTATGTGTVTSPRVVSLNPWTYLLMDIQELNTSDEIGTLGTFCKIPLDSNSFGYSFYNAVAQGTPAVQQSPPVHRLRTLTVSFRFHDGTPVDFQGVEHSFTLVLGCAPRSADTNRLRIGNEDALYRAAAAAVAKALTEETLQEHRAKQTDRPQQIRQHRSTKDPGTGASSRKVAGGVVLAVLVAGGAWYFFRRSGAPVTSL